MAFEVYESDVAHRSEEALLTVYSFGGGRINATADTNWFSDVEHVRFHYDVDENRIGIEPVEPAGQDGTVYSTHRSDGAGGDIATGSVLRTAFGIDFDAVEETHQLELEWNEDVGAAVASVEPILASATDSDGDVSVDIEVGDGEQGDTPSGDGADGAGDGVEGGAEADMALPTWVAEADVDDPDELGTRERLEIHLRHLVQEGPIMEQASDIGDPIGLSGSEVASNIRHLDGLVVEQRDPPGSGRAYQWYIEAEGEAGSEGEAGAEDVDDEGSASGNGQSGASADEQAGATAATSPDEPDRPTADGGLTGETGSEADATDGPAPTDGTDTPAESDSSGTDFEDLPVPEWLDENSFYTAVSMSTSLETLMDTLEWRESEKLAEVLDELGLWAELKDGDGDGGESE